MANPWFRMYSEFANDPKVQMLSEADQRRYVMLLCMRCSNGDVTLQDEEVAFQLRISEEEWRASKARFLSKGLIGADNKPASWGKRQYASDSSAARVAAHRERKKQKAKQASNVTETPPDTETDTEQKEITPLPPEGEAGAPAPQPIDQEPAPSDSGKVRQQRAKFDPLTACPPNVTPSVWADWAKCRKELGKPLKETTCQAQAKQLADHPNPDEVIRRSIAGGYQGLFPDRVPGNVHHLPKSRHHGFAERDYFDGLTQREDGTYGL